nr:proline-rich transmembrane protein 4 [Taeniopygia guttata]
MARWRLRGEGASGVWGCGGAPRLEARGGRVRAPGGAGSRPRGEPGFGGFGGAPPNPAELRAPPRAAPARAVPTHTRSLAPSRARTRRGWTPPPGGSGAAVPPTSLLRGAPGRPRLLPGLSELAGRLSAAGFLLPTGPPKIGAEGGNASLELDEAGSGAEPALSPGRQPSRGAAPSPAAASACTPGSACGAGGPGPSLAPPFSWPPHFLPLGTPWPEAAALWGAAWGGHVYGAGAAFALLGGLGALLLFGGRRPGLARLLGGLLAAAAFARAFPLFFDPYERGARLPPPAARALFELPPPCLGWGLALAPPARGAPLLLGLGLLHLGAALGAVGAVAALGAPRRCCCCPGRCSPLWRPRWRWAGWGGCGAAGRAGGAPSAGRGRGCGRGSRGCWGRRGRR